MLLVFFLVREFIFTVKAIIRTK